MGYGVWLPVLDAIALDVVFIRKVRARSFCG